MFEVFGALTPLRDAAEILAAHEWRRLYAPAVLAADDVPAAAAIYTDDLFSEETAAQVRGLRPWITSEYEHNGPRVRDGARTLDHLLDLARGRR